MTPEQREQIEQGAASVYQDTLDLLAYIRRLEAVAEAARRVVNDCTPFNAPDFDELDARLKELEG